MNVVLRRAAEEAQTAKSKRHLWLERIVLTTAAFILGATLVFILGKPVSGHTEKAVAAFIYADQPIESIFVDGQPVEAKVISRQQRTITLPAGKPHRVRVFTSNGYEYPSQEITIAFDGQPVMFESTPKEP